MKHNKEKSTILKIKSVVTILNKDPKPKIQCKGGGYTWVG